MIMHIYIYIHLFVDVFLWIWNIIHLVRSKLLIRVWLNSFCRWFWYQFFQNVPIRSRKCVFVTSLFRNPKKKPRVGHLEIQWNTSSNYHPGNMFSATGEYCHAITRNTREKLTVSFKYHQISSNNINHPLKQADISWQFLETAWNPFLSHEKHVFQLAWYDVWCWGWSAKPWRCNATAVTSSAWRRSGESWAGEGFVKHASWYMWYYVACIYM